MAKKTAKEELAIYQQILAGRLAEKKNIKEKSEEEITRLEGVLEETKDQIRLAISTGDMELFKDLTDQRSFTEDRLKYLREQLINVPKKIASEEEGNDFTRAILRIARENEAANMDKATKLVVELQKLIDDSFEMRTTVDGMIDQWKSKVGDIGVGRAADSHSYLSYLAELKGQLKRITAYSNILNGISIM